MSGWLISRVILNGGFDKPVQNGLIQKNSQQDAQGKTVKQETDPSNPHVSFASQQLLVLSKNAQMCRIKVRSIPQRKKALETSLKRPCRGQLHT